MASKARQDYYRDEDYYTCQRCYGSGEINVCCDDLCANSDHCIHGDGIVMCPACKGTGEVEDAE